MMRTTGSVPPTVIADTDEGYVFCMPSALAGEADKDRYAEMAKLMAVAYRARALVMIVESWVRLPDATGHLDPDVRPSQAADRKEMVALLLEDRSVSATSLIPKRPIDIVGNMRPRIFRRFRIRPRSEKWRGSAGRRRHRWLAGL
jgi:hypothetical protein